jgi:hypothetical protein
MLSLQQSSPSVDLQCVIIIYHAWTELLVKGRCINRDQFNIGHYSGSKRGHEGCGYSRMISIAKFP